MDRLFAGVLVAMWALTAPLYAANLLHNGDFEQGNVGFQTEYMYLPGQTQANSYELTTNPYIGYGGAVSYHDHTSGSGLMMMVNASDMPNVVWQQTVPVTPGTDYTFGGWWANWSGYDAWYNSLLRLTINDTTIGEWWQSYDTAHSPYKPGNGVWEFFGGDWASGGATTATITIREVSGRGTWAGNDFTLDDLSFTPVPEPTTMAGVAGASVLLMRRKRAATSARG